MAAIRYGIAGTPVEHSLSPLLTALVADHLGLNRSGNMLSMELLDVASIHDALAWGYAGAVPSPIDWVYTQAVFGKFRTKALLEKAVKAAASVEVEDPHLTTDSPLLTEHSPLPLNGLPTRMFNEEIWVNLTAPLKHQLDSSAVMCLDDSMATKSVNALRWDGKGWWCCGVDGEGILSVLLHHGIDPKQHVLGLVGGGGAARSTASVWARNAGRIHPLKSKRVLESGPWDESLTEKEPDVIVDFDGTWEGDGDMLVLNATYQPMDGDYDARIESLIGPSLNGRWMLVAQHLACWSQLWAPEMAQQLPSLPLLLTRLVEAELMLAHYA
ncbi:MAG: hypothetical protein ACPG79_01480 [Poseidonia sp.]